MKIILIIFYVLFIFVNNSYALQITKISGEIRNGKTIRIYGNNFGVKEKGSPIRWENFDDGVVGGAVDSTGYWIKRNSSSVFNNDTLRHKYSGNNIKSIHNPTVSTWFYKNNIGFSETGYAYVNFWVYLDAVSGDASWQHKLWRLNSTGEHGSAPAVINQLWFNNSNPSATSQNYYEVRNAKGVNIGTYYCDEQIKEGYWLNISVQWKASNIDKPDGDLTIWVSRNPMLSESYQKILIKNIITKVSGYNGDINAACFGYLIENGGELLYSYFDDIYMDNSWARVEIGDNISYDACTHREIQIPTSWSRVGNPDQTIEIALNQGSFVSGKEYYLFVVNNEGIPSIGHRIVFQ